MKATIINGLAIAATLTLAMTSCTEEMEWNDSSVSSPKTLFEPADNKSIQLVASATAQVLFSWQSSSAEDGGAPQYEILFDKADGDFSQPLYSIASDGNGSFSSAKVSHKDLNKIARIAGAASGESTSLKWTVVAHRGINAAQALEARTINVTRFYGFDEVPTDLFILNSAEEGNVRAAVLEIGEYEVFVNLDKGKAITLNSKADGSGTSYSISGTIISEGTTGYNVPESGVYRIKIDLNVASLVSIDRVEKAAVYFCPTDEDLIDLDYVGNGVFSGEGNIEFKPEDWGRDERYKFHMYYADGTKIVWGTKNKTDSRPNGLPFTDPYYYIKETADNQWEEKWKFDEEFDGAKVKVSLIFNVDNYTHHVEHAE